MDGLDKGSSQSSQTASVLYGSGARGWHKKDGNCNICEGTLVRKIRWESQIVNIVKKRMMYKRLNEMSFRWFLLNPTAY